MDAAISPGRILASEADDRVSGLNCGGWPAGPMRVAPVVRDQASMPSQDRVGLHQEDRPSVTVEHTRQRREDRTLGAFEARSRDLALQDHELMAQHEDVGFLGTCGCRKLVREP